MSIDGEQLAHDDIGGGVPLLLIHGFPLDRSIWRHQLDGLAGVARLIAPDLRGFGESPDVDTEVMTMEAYAADLERLLESLGVGEAVVCGLSMGGYVALALAEAIPSVVRALVLVDTKSGADTPEARNGRRQTAETARRGEVSAIADAMLPKMLSSSALDGRPEMAENVHRMMATQRPSGVAAALLGMAERPDRTRVLEGLEVPILVITGSEDAVIPTTESETMAAAARRGELVVIPGAGHLSNLEQPAAFNAAVGGLLADL